MPLKPGSRLEILGGALTGFLAGALTVTVPNVIAKLGSPLYLGIPFGLFVGDIFGIVISAHFWIYFHFRSLAKALGFVLVSAVAYIAAFFLTLYSAPLCARLAPGPYGGDLRVAPVSLAFFLGGAVGAVLVIFAAQLLLSGKTIAEAFHAAFTWCAFGGVLGAVGWALQPSLGKLAFKLVSPPANYADESATYSYSCFLIWQTGMGVVLSFLAAEEKVAEAAVNSTPRPHWLAVVRYVFMVVFFGTLLSIVALIARKEVPGYVESVRWSRAYEKHEAEMPSLVGLPQVESMPAEQMLIVRSIDGYIPDRTYEGQSNEALDPKTIKPRSPRAQTYSVRYARRGAPTSGGSVGPHVDVQVKEYPTSQWAKWMISEQGYTLSSTQKQTAHGNVIYSSTSPSYPGNALYLWVSQNRVLILQCYEVNTVEFLDEYLQKYPSSL